MDRKKIRFRLSLTEFIYNGCFAAANFLSVFLESDGFTAGQMGLITALISGVGIASQPTWGIISDRVRSVKKCFMLCMACSAVCALAVPPLSAAGGAGRVLTVGMLTVMYFFFHPSNMMMEMWLVRVNDNPLLKIPYGTVRSWASIGYALISLAFVPVLRAMNVRNVYYFFFAFAFLAFLLTSFVPSESEGEGAGQGRRRLRDMPFRALLDYWIAAYVVFEVLYLIPFSWRVTYMVFGMKEFGADTSLYGALMFVSGICEVPMLLLVKRFSGRRGWGWPLIASAVFLSAEYAVYALGHSLPLLILAQLLRGFSYALYVSGRVRYLSRLAPKGMEASTMALVNTITAVTNLLAAAGGGFLLEALGTRPFFGLLCAVQMVSVLAFIGSHVFGVRFLKKLPADPQCLLVRPGKR